MSEGIRTGVNIIRVTRFGRRNNKQSKEEEDDEEEKDDAVKYDEISIATEDEATMALRKLLTNIIHVIYVKKNMYAFNNEQYGLSRKEEETQSTIIRLIHTDGLDEKEKGSLRLYEKTGTTILGMTPHVYTIKFFTTRSTVINEPKKETILRNIMHFLKEDENNNIVRLKIMPAHFDDMIVPARYEKDDVKFLRQSVLEEKKLKGQEKRRYTVNLHGWKSLYETTMKGFAIKIKDI